MKMNAIIRLMKEFYGYPEIQSELRDPFRTLISCVLSHRTRDENSAEAARRLFEAAVTPEEIVEMDLKELKERIKCSGFYNQKAENIMAICRVLVEEYESRVPEDREEMMELRGVGPKTADMVLSHAFGELAIPVDIHVARVAKRLGFVEEEADPERVKETLESLVSPDEYNLLDSSFVRHGKELCKSRKPICGECFLKLYCKHNDHFGSS
jgi:endonuclease-3